MYSIDFFFSLYDFIVFFYLNINENYLSKIYYIEMYREWYFCCIILFVVLLKC